MSIKFDRLKVIEIEIDVFSFLFICRLNNTMINEKCANENVCFMKWKLYTFLCDLYFLCFSQLLEYLMSIMTRTIVSSGLFSRALFWWMIINIEWNSWLKTWTQMFDWHRFTYPHCWTIMIVDKYFFALMEIQTYNTTILTDINWSIFFITKCKSG